MSKWLFVFGTKLLFCELFLLTSFLSQTVIKFFFRINRFLAAMSPYGAVSAPEKLSFNQLGSTLIKNSGTLLANKQDLSKSGGIPQSVLALKKTQLPQQSLKDLNTKMLAPEFGSADGGTHTVKGPGFAVPAELDGLDPQFYQTTCMVFFWFLFACLHTTIPPLFSAPGKFQAISFVIGLVAGRGMDN